MSGIKRRAVSALAGASAGLFAWALPGVALSTLIGVTAQADQGAIEEVIVTSRRTEESAQDVPLSVTAFGTEQIERLKPTTLRDFDGLAPNLYIGMNTAGPGASALFIRGVGYADIEKTQSPQVGVIVDGLQLGSSTGQLIDVFDVESIEINRGPQGVLFGKNTIGGNIVVNRVRPQLDEFGYKASVELGNYDSRTVKGRVNIPLVADSLALKIGGTYREREGYYENKTIGGTAGDVEFSAGTIALRWAPNDAFDGTVTYDFTRDRSQIPPQDPRFDGDDPFVNLADKREPADYDVNQLGIRFDWDVSDTVTIHNITGWHKGDDLVNQDFDGGSITGAAIPFAQLHTLRDQEYEVFTQEIRASFDVNDKIDVNVGLYYLDSELSFRQTTSNVLQLPTVALGVAACPGSAFGLRPNQGAGLDFLCQFPNARSQQIASEDVQSVSVFGSINWRPTDNLEFSVGARWIDEEKDATNSYFDFTDGTYDDEAGRPDEFDFTGLPSTVGTAYSVSDSWDDIIIQASANWAYAENNSAYVSYSEGFRSGGFSIRSARDPSEAAFDPEDAYQIEIGFKNEFLDRRLRANLAMFRLVRDNTQFSSIITLPPGSIPGTTTIINNGGEVEIEGIELETAFLINENWTFSFNAGLIDVNNKRYSIACDVLDGCATGVPGVLDPSGTLRERGGNDDSRQPDWNLSTNLAYDKQVGAGQFSANVQWKKVGNFLLVNTGGGADQRLFEGGYQDISGRIAYSVERENGDAWSVSLIGKNLSDEEWKEQALFLGGPTTGFQGWGAPATYSIEFQYEH